MKHCHIFNNLNDFYTYYDNNVDFEKPIDEPQDALPILAYCKLELVMRYPDQFVTVYIQCLNDPNDEGGYDSNMQYLYYKGEDAATELGNINIWHKRVTMPLSESFYNYSINAFMNGKDITSTNTRIVVLTNPTTSLGMIFVGKYVDYYLDIPYITGDIEIY